jgi:hypothetical protein
MEIDVIKSNIEGLSDEQYEAIANLSKESERALTESLTKDLTGKIHQSYDEDMKALGYEKPQGTKSYEHVKSVITSLKGDNEKAQSEIARLQELTKKGDEGLRKLYEDEKSRVGDLQKELKAMQDREAEMAKDYDNKLRMVKIDGELERAISGMSFNSDIDEGLRTIAIERAKTELLNEYTAEVENGVLIFRDAEGKVKNNPSNGMKPYTATELMAEKSYLKAVLKQGRTATGAGANGNGGNTDVSYVDLSQCKTQMEADDVIAKYLMGKGMVRTTMEFQKEFDKIRKEQNVAKLRLF